ARGRVDPELRPEHVDRLGHGTHGQPRIERDLRGDPHFHRLLDGFEAREGDRHRVGPDGDALAVVGPAARIVAPGPGAPLSSVTIPRISPVRSWARTDAGRKAQTATSAASSN